MAIAAAEAIIADEGVERLTARKVAIEMGYTVGSIYMVFDNMHDLVLHVNARTLAALDEHLAKVDMTDSDERLAALANAYIHFVYQHYARWRMAFDAYGQVGVATPEWYRQRIDAAYQPFAVAFGQLLPAATPRQVNLAARAFWSGLHGACLLTFAAGVDQTAKSVAESLVNLLVERLLKADDQ